LIVQADARRIPLADRSVDLVIGSPPYLDARTYLEDGRDLGIARPCREWVSWMLDVTTEALRVSRGLVLWVVAGRTEDWCYQPGPEGLLWEWWERGGECHLFRPCYWHRVGIPGSGQGQWYRADVEYVLAFKRPGKLPYGDAAANGHKPTFKAGGAMSNRMTDGSRQNSNFKKGGGNRAANGKRKNPDSPCHERYKTEGLIANPGCLISTGVAGGGHTAPGFALQGNEAPYPEAVPAFFINSHTPPSGLVCDPFSGSGTTIAAARSLGRRGIGFDLRPSQCRLTRKRLAGVTPGFTFAEAHP
jgi:hypothetical protein